MRNQASVYQRVCKNLVQTEATWIRHSEDLAALAPDAEHGWFNDFLEDLLNKVSKKALMVSSHPFLLVLLNRFSHLILALLHETPLEPLASSKSLSGLA